MVIESLKIDLARKEEEAKRLEDDLGRAKKQIVIAKAEKDKVL